MTKTFTYSVLQYKHSLLLREAVNVGIIFCFADVEKLEFVTGNAARVKAIYPDFDQSIFNHLTKGIERRLKILLEDKSLKKSIFTTQLNAFIDERVFRDDETALQFASAVTVIDSYNNTDETVEKFSALLLPGINTKKIIVARHNENFILRKYLQYFSENDKLLEAKLIKNRIVKARGVELKFDIAWQNGTLNLVKPLSFDLKEEQDIQNKSAQLYGYLSILKNEALKENYRFDILVSRPQDGKLLGSYKKAIDILNDSGAPQRIIEDTKIEAYSRETIDYLKKN